MFSEVVYIVWQYLAIILPIVKPKTTTTRANLKSMYQIDALF